LQLHEDRINDGSLSAMKPFARFLLTFGCVLVGTLVYFAGQGRPRLSADDLWAEALWMSLPPSDASSEEMSQRFVSAIEHARCKAPIYVSFGDKATGSLTMKEGMDAVMEAIDSNLAAAARESAVFHGVEQSSPVPSDSSVALERILKKSLRNSLDGQRVDSAFERWRTLTEAKTETSIACYAAAIAEDPNYLPAWHRLAAYAEGDLQKLAIRELQQRDPGNAMAWYFAANRAARDNDIDGVLVALETGNARPRCRSYPAALPTKFRFVIPTTPDLGVAGRRLTPTGLRRLVRHFDEMFSWADPFPGQFRRSVCYRLIDDGRQLAAGGNYGEAIRHFEAVRDVGLHLMRVEPCDSNQMVLGMVYASHANDELLKATESQGDAEKRAAAQVLSGKLQSFRALFQEAIKTPEIAPAELFIGNRDLLAEEEIRLEAALTLSGFASN